MLSRRHGYFPRRVAGTLATRTHGAMQLARMATVERTIRPMAPDAGEALDLLGAPMVVKSDPATMGLVLVDHAMRSGRIRPAASARGGGRGLPNPQFTGGRRAGSKSVEALPGAVMGRGGETRLQDRYLMPKARREALVEGMHPNLAMVSDLDGLEPVVSAFEWVVLHGDRIGVASAPRPVPESWAAGEAAEGDDEVDGEAPATLVVNQRPVMARPGRGRGLRLKEGEVADG